MKFSQIDYNINKIILNVKKIIMTSYFIMIHYEVSSILYVYCELWHGGKNFVIKIYEWINSMKID